MSADRFSIDANILVYAVSLRDGAKNSLALEILRRSSVLDCVLTLQALGEFYTVSIRKGGMPPEVAAGQVERWLDIFPNITSSQRSLRAALTHVRNGRASYWDALLMETASENGCAAVISEDMADGAVFGGARVVHAFDGDRLSDAASALLS